MALGWKELPGSSVTPQSASGTFGKGGFVISVSAFPAGENLHIQLQNHSNIRPGKLPVPPATKPVYVGDTSAMHLTEASVAATAEACRGLLLAGGWVPYGSAGDSVWYRQNGVRVTATVSSAPAQGGKTMIAYSTEMLSAEIPAPPDADEIRYSDQSQELRFETTMNEESVAEFYRQALAPAQWQPTLEQLVQVDGKDTMIFRNPSKDMLTLSFSGKGRVPLPVLIKFQSAAEMAELDRRFREKAPALIAAAEARRAQDAGQAPLRIAVTLPAGASVKEQSKSAIKLAVGHGRAKGIAESWQKEFRTAGWNEEVASLDTMAGALSFARETQRLTVDYTDTGFTPAEVNLSVAGAELEVK